LSLKEKVMAQRYAHAWSKAAAAIALSWLAPARADSAADLEAVNAQVKTARDNIQIVERQYSQRDEPTDEAGRAARFSDGEVQYLLGDYSTASVLFYDLVANKDFQSHPRYADALFYLADALYQQKNYLGSRLYLRQLLALKAGHYKEALARYLEIAGRLNEFAGIEEFVNQARGLSGGNLPPELSYVYAKWLFRREDLTPEERIPRAQAIFNSLAAANGPLALASAYFVGVGHVKLKKYDEAINVFKGITSQAGRDERENQVKELAWMSLGRVQFELGQFDEAIVSYREIPPEPKNINYPDSLYETAWAHIRKKDFARARNATELLKLVSEGTVLEPEADILAGTLQLKLQKYDEASEEYERVGNKYGAVYDEIHALLSTDQDPVKFFDNMLAKNDKNLDVTALLPPVALKWASTRRDVGDAVEIVGAIEAGKGGVEEANVVANRILKALDERGLESFPVMQEGYTRADAVETTVTRAEESLTTIEGDLVGAYLNERQRAELAAAEKEVAALKARVATLPTTEDDLKARKARIQAKVDSLDREAYKISIDIQSNFAQLAAIGKYVDDTRATRKTSPEDEKAFLEKVMLEKRGLEDLLTQVQEVRQKFQDERNNAENAVSGEDKLRAEYSAALELQRALYQQARGSAPADAQKLLLRADVIRTDATAVRERVGQAKNTLRDRVSRRAQRLREMVLAEQSLLAGYQKEVGTVSNNARYLVGRIAFESFKRVRQSFYELVLKANVGLVDVAFTRKQDVTGSIQKLASEKDRELRQLDEEFKEVLKDVE
jgi:TolA-binding protein